MKKLWQCLLCEKLGIRKIQRKVGAGIFRLKNICFYLVYDCVNTVVFLVTLLRGLSGKVATIVPFPSRLWPWQSFHHNTFRQLWYLSGCIQICVGLFRAPSSETMHIVMQNGTSELSARLSSSAITLPFRREWPFRNANFFQLVRIPIGIKGNWIALFASVKCAA